MTVHGMHREASIEIHASPEAVYDLVSDLPRMGEWSPENIGGEWQDGGSGQVGDRYIGHNRTASAHGRCGDGHVPRRGVLCFVRAPRRPYGRDIRLEHPVVARGCGSVDVETTTARVEGAPGTLDERSRSPKRCWPRPRCHQSDGEG